LKRRIVGSGKIIWGGEYTRRTIKPVGLPEKQITILNQRVQGNRINPYQPFLGVDGQVYEIDWKPEGNCYSYALRTEYPDSQTKKSFSPGVIAGKTYKPEKIKSLIIADLKKQNRIIYEVVDEIPKELPKGEGYWIKCFIAEGNRDFHFALKDPKSGRWLHKIGWIKSPSLMMRNTRVEGTKEILLRLAKMQKSGALFAEGTINFFLMQMGTPLITVLENVIEDDDSSDYLGVISTEEKPVLYKAVFAMRISEPN